jgi:hypothetical protein
MVWFNSSECGIRLGLTTCLGISVSCTRCHHAANIRLDVALRLWGERTFARDIARDLRCSICGANAASTQVISDTRPPELVRMDPGGGFQQGCNYPLVDPPLSPAWIAAKQRGWL